MSPIFRTCLQVARSPSAEPVGRDGLLGEAEDVTDVDSPKTADRRLHAEQLAADADALDQLLDDRLVVRGPDGSVYSKQDDLEQRSGRQRSTEVIEGSSGPSWLVTPGSPGSGGRLAGRFKGEDFVAQVRRPYLDQDCGRLAVARVARQPGA